MTNGTTPKNNAIVLKTQSEQERISSIRVQVLEDFKSTLFARTLVTQGKNSSVRRQST